jgi:lysophospholipase L1-like esterase
MSVYDSKAYPRMGWAQPLADLFAPSCARVVDKALSGRSSKSFLDEGAWNPVKDALKSGDFVLIQFGHNDEKSDNAALYTEPQTTYKQHLTTYVNDTRAKQATPILLTSINRNNWSGTTLSDTHKAYPPAVRELAEMLDVPLIDHEALTRAYFERIGPSETAKLFMILAAGQSPNYPNGVTDNTHLQETGARAIGQLAMADAYARRLPLAGLLEGMPVAP